jgi:uncharacterized protein
MKDKVVVITGASTGLGKEIAIKLAKLGANIALVARTEKELQITKNEIVKLGGNAEYFICDVSNPVDVKRAVKDIFSKFNKVDILINNAGIWTDESLEEKDSNLRKRAFETNALGNIQFTYEVLPYFKKMNSGYIFNVISVAGSINSPAGDNSLWKTYGATKWAMTGFTKALRDSLKDTKIKISAFHPGGFESMLYEKAKRLDSHNQPWMMKASDVADIVVFALTRPDDVLLESITVTKSM